MPGCFRWAEEIMVEKEGRVGHVLLNAGQKITAGRILSSEQDGSQG
jgi:hypothetical protein